MHTTHSAHMGFMGRIRYLLACPYLRSQARAASADEAHEWQRAPVVQPQPVQQTTGKYVPLSDRRPSLQVTQASVEVIQAAMQPAVRPVGDGFDLQQRQQAMARMFRVKLLPPPPPLPESKPAPKPPRLPEDLLADIKERNLDRIVNTDTEPVPPGCDPAIVTVGMYRADVPLQANPLAPQGALADLFAMPDNDAWLNDNEARETTQALEELAELATLRHNSETLKVPSVWKAYRDAGAIYGETLKGMNRWMAEQRAQEESE